MNPAEVTAANTAAARTAGPWWRGSALARVAVLTAAAARPRKRAGQIAVDLVREMGKPLAEARVEKTKAADFLDHYAGLARSPYGTLLDVEPGLEDMRFYPRVTTVAIGHSVGGAR